MGDDDVYDPIHPRIRRFVQAGPVFSCVPADVQVHHFEDIDLVAWIDRDA